MKNRFLFILFLSFNLFSFEGEIYKVGNEVIKVGDKVELNLETSVDLEISEIEELIKENKSKLGSFYIIDSKKHDEKRFKLYGIYESPMNAQVFQIAKNSFRVNNPELFSKEFAKNIQEFHVFKKDVKKVNKSKASIWIVFSILGLLLLSLGAFVFKKNRNRTKTANRNKLKREWKLSLDRAKTRQDFEEIYKGKKSLEKLFSIKSNAFFDELNEVQYKKDWDELDLQKIKKAFNSFRSNL